MSRTRTNAIIRATTLTDLSNYVGCAVILSGSPTGPRAELWSEDEIPFGVILYADAESVSVAPFEGGYAGTFLCKVLEECSPGARLYCVNSGPSTGFGTSDMEDFPGATFYSAVAVESGLAGEMVEAIPRSLSAVTLT